MKPFPDSTLTAAHGFSARHQPLLRTATLAGCFFCGATFHPREITQWLPEPGPNPPELTAGCPRCGIDAVLPDHPPVRVTADLLAALHGRWFATRLLPDAR
jgi:hypothetical protein